MRFPLRLAVPFAVVSAALPLLLARPAPLTDWPNHLARVEIATDMLRGDPFWSRFYTLNPVPVPNAALDLGIGALHLAGLSVDVAGSLFLALAYAVFVFGFCRLARAAAGPAAPSDLARPLLGSILFFTGPLMFGLVNYMLGLGVACWLLALWLEAPPWRRAVLALLGTLALFYVHLLAAAVWVLVIGCLEAPAVFAALRRRAEMLRPLARASGAVAAGVMFLGLLIGSAAGGDSLPESDGSNLWFPGHGRLIPTLAWKSSILLRMASDHATPPMLTLTLAGLTAFALLVTVCGRPRIAAGPLLAVGAMAVAVLVLPESAGTGSLLDYRLALVPFLLAAAFLRLDWRSPLARNLAVAVLLVVSLARTAGFARAFIGEESVIHEFDAALAALPSGSILLTAFGHSRDGIPDAVWWSPPMEHLAARAVSHRVFVPTIFAVAAQQPLVLRDEFDPWRRTWQVRNPAEFAAMADDVRPLCARAAAAARRVFLFVAYPSPFLDSVVDPADMLASNRAFRLLDLCAVPRFAS
jgi:hypothetical protein